MVGNSCSHDGLDGHLYDCARLPAYSDLLTDMYDPFVAYIPSTNSFSSHTTPYIILNASLSTQPPPQPSDIITLGSSRPHSLQSSAQPSHFSSCAQHECQEYPETLTTNPENLASALAAPPRTRRTTTRRLLVTWRAHPSKGT